MTLLSPKVQRFAFVGLNVFALVVLAKFIVVPFFRSANEAAERMRDAQFDLARAKSADRQLKGISENTLIQAEKDISRFMQTGSTLSSSTVNMQSNVSRLVKESGLNLDSMTIETVESRAALLKPVVIVIKVKGREAAFVHFLESVESQEQVLRIDSINVQQREMERPEGGAPNTAVDAELKIVGLWSELENKPK